MEKMKRSFSTANGCARRDEADDERRQSTRRRLAMMESPRRDTSIDAGVPEVRGNMVYLNGDLGIPIPTTEGARNFLMEMGSRLAELQRDLIELEEEHEEDDYSDLSVGNDETVNENNEMPAIGINGVGAAVEQCPAVVVNSPCDQDYCDAYDFGYSACMREALDFLLVGGFSEDDEIYRVLQNKLSHLPP